ncbi:YwbE family protein [Brevibacillus centrosporus]|uniref:YwbE family protein n=1 Tax=Brevibacillus centrosporus TaxID=54910 RepID=UPI0037F9ACF2
MNGKNRKDIAAGLEVDIVLKQDQRTGKRTRGIIKDLLTNSGTHPHGIKVRLTDGQVGRVQEIYPKR